MTLKSQPSLGAQPSAISKTPTLKSEKKVSKLFSTPWTLKSIYQEDLSTNPSLWQLKAPTVWPVEELSPAEPSNKEVSRLEMKSSSMVIIKNSSLSALEFRPLTRLWTTEKQETMLVFWSEVWLENRLTEVWWSQSPVLKSEFSFGSKHLRP